MKYMVVERHPGYAVVLDDDGNFLKVANRSYEIGQMLTAVVPIQMPEKRKPGKWIAGLAAMAACLALVFGMFLPGTQQPYASVYVKINPEVRIDVDQQDVVVGLAGVNQDGTDLIAGYDFRKKSLDTVTDELVDRAIDMGYLTAEGQITISLESQDQLWVEKHCQSISNHLQGHLQERFVVTVQVQMHHDLHQESHEPIPEHHLEIDDWDEPDDYDDVDDWDEPDDYDDVEDRDEPENDDDDDIDDRDEEDDDEEPDEEDRHEHEDDHEEEDHHEEDDSDHEDEDD